MVMEPRFLAGCQHFNAREYFEAHEIWEEVWQEESGARRAFLQCLIQVAVALHHAENSNWAGSKKLLSRCLDYWEKGLMDSEPVNMESLKDNILEFAIQVEKNINGETVALPFFALPLNEKP